LPGDLPVVGDWDGDGVDTIGVYRQGQFLLRNSNRPGPADIVLNFGEVGDLPLAGDWDGDGQVTVGVYNTTTGLFKLSNTLKNVLADVVVQWGGPGYLPVVGDWDGDGIATIGLYGVVGEFLLRNTNAAGHRLGLHARGERRAAGGRVVGVTRALNWAYASVASRSQKAEQARSKSSAPVRVLNEQKGRCRTVP
jgi:hypothetical protein